MPTKFEPVLASPVEREEMKFPLIGTPKYDGWRIVGHPEYGFVTRRLEQLGNTQIRTALEAADLTFHDGEIVTYTDGEADPLATVQSKVSKPGEVDWRFHVFDHFQHPNMPYTDRLALLSGNPIFQRGRIELVPHEPLRNMAEFDEYERAMVDTLGFEGVMLRHPDGRYKFGRSTVTEAILLKFKRFSDDEATIVSTFEQLQNTNEATVNKIGKTKRSSAKDGKVGKGTLGGFWVDWNGIRFKLSTGLSADQRADLWARRDSLPGKRITFRYKGVGPNGKPLIASIVTIREDL